MIRILIVDDHVAIRVGLASMLGTYPDFTVMGAVGSGEEALTMLEREVPDVILLDLRMQGLGGMGVLDQVKRRRFAARVIVHTSFETDEEVFKAVSAGAHGYLLKDCSEEELVNAIRTVHSGKSYLPQYIASKLANRIHRPVLSSRELEVLGMLAKGLTNKQIGTALGISDYTVRSHVANITEKLEVTDRTEAVVIAIRLGVLQMS